MAGYSGTPLFKKLGYKPGFRVLTINAPDDYRDLLGEVPAGVEFVGPDAKEIDLIHCFAVRAEEVVGAIVAFKGSIRRNGSIWISWYKKSAKIPTDITEDLIRDAALMNGLVDVKVCAVDEKWSALKLVIPVADR